MKELMEILVSYLNKLTGLNELKSLELLEEESSLTYRTYKLIYSNVNGKIKKKRIEIDVSKEKISFGKWKSANLKTVKFKNLLDTDTP